jgi:hypothetical protein
LKSNEYLDIEKLHLQKLDLLSNIWGAVQQYEVFFVVFTFL